MDKEVEQELANGETKPLDALPASTPECTKRAFLKHATELANRAYAAKRANPGMRFMGNIRASERMPSYSRCYLHELEEGIFALKAVGQLVGQVKLEYDEEEYIRRYSSLPDVLPVYLGSDDGHMVVLVGMELSKNATN